VATRELFREQIEANLAETPVPNLNFIYADLPAWTRIFKKRGAPSQIYYYLWQAYAYLKVRRPAKQIGFDVAHHVTFVKYWAPSFVPFLGIPCVWGPVGGGESRPRGFLNDFSLLGKVYEILRDLARGVSEFDPFVRLTARRTTVAIATTEETAVRLRAIGAKNVHTAQAIALAPEDLETFQKMPVHQTEHCRFVSVGRLLDWKGFHLGLEAFAEMATKTSEYWIIGDGPQLASLERLADHLGVADRVRFLGRLPRDETYRKLSECDVLVHPSLHESGGLVCLEAMAAGRPVICLELGGPAMHVTKDTGILIPVTDRRQTIAAMAEEMTTLANDKDQRMKLGLAARARVNSGEYMWDSKARAYTALYLEALAGRPVAAHAAQNSSLRRRQFENSP
jgi:glycosyltransferase involved in cell wall biosynthesis